MKISIIIPIYNAEKVLGRTIDSVLSQGLIDAEYELILINDGSSDNSLDICNIYANMYPGLIKVFTKINEGVSKARNLGILEASGDYLYFMDADDYLIPGGFRYLLDNYFSCEYDILAFRTSTINDFDENHLPIENILGEIVYDGFGIDYLKYHWPTFVVNQIFRKAFIKSYEVEFQEMNYSEDLYFNLQVWSKNPKVRIVSSCIYRYIIYDGNNQATKNRDNEHLRRCISSHMKLFSYISELNVIFQEKYNSTNMEALFQSVMRSFMSRVLSSDISTSEFRDIINRLSELKLVPMKNIKTRNAKIMDIMIRNSYMFPVFRFFYKQMFVPFVLPRLSRE